MESESRNALIVGGANGIGLAIAYQLADYDRVYIIDKATPEEALPANACFEQFDLTTADYSIFDRYQDISLLMITAGFGRLQHFSDIPEDFIISTFQVNTIAAIRVVKHYYDHLQHDKDFLCGVMVSIAGFLSSPLFSVYGASKAALRIFIESVNIELEKTGSTNKILNISPGSIKGTRFNGGNNELCETEALAKEIVAHLKAKDDLFIPKYDEVYHDVLERYHKDFRAEGRHSYDYKMQSGRMK